MLRSRRARMQLWIRGRDECLATEVECARGFFARILGLMLRASIPEGYALLVPLPSRKGSIHMLFMRFPIDLLLLDGHMRVMSIHTLKPWRDVVFFEGAHWAVEMRKGQASAHNVGRGDMLELRR